MQGDCPFNYFVDGAHFPFEHNSADPFPIPVTDIMAMEIYAGTAQIPAEFQRMANSCGAIVIWTKRGGGTPRKR